MKTELMTVTPKMAEQFLSNNLINRVLRTAKVRKYRRDMERGFWAVTHQGIAISKKGNLLDGQHRLMAIVQSGMTIDMMVTTGLDESIFSKVDRGFTRTTSEAAKIPKRHLEIVQFIGHESGNRQIHESTEDLNELYKVIGETIIDLADYCNSNKKGVATAGIRSAAVIAALSGDRDYAFKTYRDMVLSNFDKLPPSAANFMKQLSSGSLVPGGTSGGATQLISFVKAMDVFSEKNRDLRQLRYSEEKEAMAIHKLKVALLLAGSK